MRTVFADAGYWIALLNPRDQLHERAKQVARSLGAVRTVTSEVVLTECLNDFSRRGTFMRRLAVGLVERLRADENTVIVPQTSVQFREALALYATRADKTWSHTDCASVGIMEHYSLREALTHDRNFEQAGFRPLLRDGV
jgi:predicted nucleic acid-binding protein